MSTDPELLRKWVDTWRRASPELDRIRAAELLSIDTREVIRQIFEVNVPRPEQAPATSGLVEQQAWFIRLYNAQRKP